MNGENQRLREALNQVIVNYNTLENHLAMMIQQKQGGENRNGEGSTTTRQVMDLALADPTKAEINEKLQSTSSEERNHDEQLRPVINNQNTGNKDQSSVTTVRKARVSIRARSEASMVFINQQI